MNTESQNATFQNATFQNGVALVTGASRGIGAAIAKRLGRDGFKVAVHFKSNSESAKKISDEIPNSELFQYDLSSQEACQNLIQDVTKKMGPIRVLVNNAGIAIDQILPFAKPEDFDTLISTNLKPVFLLSKFVSKGMIKQKYGRIINIASVVGYSGNPGQSMYSATKAAITGMTKSMSYDLAGFGIHANCVAPGFIQTEMTDKLSAEAKEYILAKVPLKRLGQPDDIASAVSFLASKDADYITGSTIHVNGGLFPN